MKQFLDSENHISFDINEYDGSYSRLFEDVAKICEILTRNGYEISFRYDDCGIYVLDFNYEDEAFGTPKVYWLDPDQVECLFTEHYIDEEKDKKRND